MKEDKLFNIYERSVEISMGILIIILSLVIFPLGIWMTTIEIENYKKRKLAEKNLKLRTRLIKYLSK